MTGTTLLLGAALVLIGLFAISAFGFARQTPRRRRTDRRPDPLQDLMKQDNLGRAIDLALHRDAKRSASQAVLLGQIEPLAGVGEPWSSDARARLREHLTAVLRVSLRRDDHIAIVTEHAENDRFAILVPGADERAAMRIAERLRGKVGELRLPRFAGEARLTASFGVAAGSIALGSETLQNLAQRALEVALALGQDNVVPASAIGEPAPRMSAEPKASAA